MTNTFTISRFTPTINLHLSYLILYHRMVVHLGMKVEH